MDRGRRSSAVTVTLIGLLAAWFMWSGDESAPDAVNHAPTPVVAGPSVEVATSDPAITVHVTGAVANPGLVTLPSTARVADAIAAAGGATAEAELALLNLAAGLTDGGQVVVPSTGPGPTGVARETGGASPATAGVDLNVADATVMQQLPGVGPVLAERIVAFRDTHGPFEAVEDLLDVPGIGEGKLAGLRDAVAAP